MFSIGVMVVIVLNRLESPCSGCAAPYGFHNQLRLTDDTSQFRVSVIIDGQSLTQKNMMNKKVLLRERKRHTDRGVSSTPSVILYEEGYPPPRSGLTGGGEYPRWGTPVRINPPQPGLTGGYPRWGTPRHGVPPQPGLTGVI